MLEVVAATMVMAARKTVEVAEVEAEAEAEAEDGDGQVTKRRICPQEMPRGPK